MNFDNLMALENNKTINETRGKMEKSPPQLDNNKPSLPHKTN